jgi:1-deoxy-D-xylulose-5-phosphate reductoisomerase
MKKLAILGSTGSIGTQALEIVAGSDRFQVVGLAAGSNWEAAVGQARRHGVPVLALADTGAAERARSNWDGRVLEGEEGVRELVAESGADLVLNGIVGAAGLGPTIVALGEGIDVALANKESLVIGGELTMALAEATGARLLPVDSEHSALFQLIGAEAAGTVERLVLTASGGPFRGRDPATLARVTPDEACAHPNWVMGRKISVDSATMMNKALEVIEAHFLFGLAPEQIEVVIHPQSIIHSMVVCQDQSVLAQLGTPDMRVPIAYGLGYPDRISSGAQALDWSAMAALTFEPADLRLYPGLGLAWDALRAAPGSTAVLNAANEEAVAAFLAGTVSFDRIHTVNCRTIESLSPSSGAADSLESLLALDQEARLRARGFLKDLAR